MQSVTSNAVAVTRDVILQGFNTKANTQDFYDANTNRGLLQNRINAITQYLPRTLGGIYRIRYEGGYYYAYITAGNSSEETIFEIDPYGGTICIFQRNGGGSVALVRSI